MHWKEGRAFLVKLSDIGAYSVQVLPVKREYAVPGAGDQLMRLVVVGQVLVVATSNAFIGSQCLHLLSHLVPLAKPRYFLLTIRPGGGTLMELGNPPLQLTHLIA